MEHRLSEKWIKASIAGTLWAASEIVLGSFLHNLRIPFSGNILTAIGLVILISISYVWNERGLFWRAGLICALMKTLSPSAVIFGPMIAIFTESLLLQLSVSILGKSIPGFLIGSMLAMSWNLFQKIVNFVILYGSDITIVYSNLLKWTQKQLSIQSDIVWLPIIVLLVLFAIFGLLSGITGIIVGRRLLSRSGSSISQQWNNSSPDRIKKPAAEFSYSVAWLLVDIVLMAGAFILLNRTSWIFWGTYTIVIILLWSLRYKRALRQLSRPRFWIFFVVVTLITAFVFTRAQHVENPLTAGLLTGFQMNFRAAAVIFGFSVIGTELYNPVIRKFFSGTAFRNLPLALELSVESLPSFISNIPDLKSLVRNPVSIFHAVISQAESRLTEIKGRQESGNKIFIISGPVDGGKTTFLEKLIKTLGENGVIVDGIISGKVLLPEGRRGYDIVNILTGHRIPFLREDPLCGKEMAGRFNICKDGLDAGRQILSSLEMSGEKIVAIDEIGNLEINGGGWSTELERILKRPFAAVILVVRSSLVGKVIRKWELGDPVIFDIGKTDHTTAAKQILVFSGRTQNSP